MAERRNSMRKSTRGTKPSARFLESLGVQVDGFTPARRREGAEGEEAKALQAALDASMAEQARADVEEQREAESRSKNSRRSGKRLEDPLTKRCRALEIFRGQFKRLFERILRADRYGLVLGAALGGVEHPRGTPVLAEVSERLERGDYYIVSLDEEDWVSSRAAIKLLEQQGYFDEKNELKREDFLGIDYDVFEADVQRVLQHALDNNPPSEDHSSYHATATRLREFVKEQIAALRQRHEEEMKKVINDERLDRLSIENREPAMNGWRKRPFEARHYNVVKYYTPVPGLSEEEAAAMMDKLHLDEKENRWITSDGIDFGFDEEAIAKDPAAWTVKEVGKHVVETDTWGIDPFARRNILIALESVKEPDLRMSQPQMQWFIEGMLLLEINAQPSDVAFDICASLKAIRDRAEGALGDESGKRPRKRAKLPPSEELDKAKAGDAGADRMEEDNDGPEAKKNATAETTKEGTAGNTDEGTKVAPAPAPAPAPVAAPPATPEGTAKGENVADAAAASTAVTEAAVSEAAEPPAAAEEEKAKAANSVPTQKQQAAEPAAKEGEAGADTNGSSAADAKGSEQPPQSPPPPPPPDTEEGKSDQGAAVAEVKKEKGRARANKRRLKGVAADNIIWSSSRRERKKPNLYTDMSQVKEETPSPPAAAATPPKTGKAERTTSRKRGRRKGGGAAAASAPASADSAAPPAPAPAKRSRSGGSAGRKRKARSSRPSRKDDGLVGTRISVFWPLDCVWYWGRIVEFASDPEEEGMHHRVHYDDGYEEWVDLTNQRCILENRRETIYDKNIPAKVIIAAVDAVLQAHEKWGAHNFCVHPKGTGVVCKEEGIPKGHMVGQYFGELYPLWLWEQKEAREDAQRRAAQRESGAKVMLPDFWNMRLELPPDAEGGVEMMYVDAKYNGTFTSRLSHSCRPNCTTMLAVVGGRYAICVRAVRNIEPGEELCIDYNCVTDSIDEFRAAICLCGSEGCRGSFLYITGAQQYMQVVNRRHRTIHRVAMLFEASFEEDVPPPGSAPPTPKPKSKPSGSRRRGKKRASAAAAAAAAAAAERAEEEAAERARLLQRELGNVVGASRLDFESVKRLVSFGLKSNALRDLPIWLLRYSALALRFVELEQLELPARLFHEELDRRQKLAQTTAAATAAASSNVPTSGRYKEQIDGDIAKDLWENVQREGKGIAHQRVSHLLIAINKARHRMAGRIHLGLEGASQRLVRSILNIDSSKLVQYGADSPRNARSGVHEARLQALITESDAKLMERVWWIADRCEAKWCGDDAESYPGWYPGTILQVHNEGLRTEPGSTFNKTRANLLNVPSVHILYDDGDVIDRIPMTDEILRRPVLTKKPLAIEDAKPPQAAVQDAAEPLPKAQDAEMKPADAGEAKTQPAETAGNLDEATAMETDVKPDDTKVAETAAEEDKTPAEDGKTAEAGAVETVATTGALPQVKVEKATNSEESEQPQPRTNKDGKYEYSIALPLTGLSCIEHQSPFRPLTDSEVADALWAHPTNSIARRVMRMLAPRLHYSVRLWQCADNPLLRRSYWWNIETKQVSKSKPTEQQSQFMIDYTPPAAERMMRLLESRKVRTAAEARRALETLRDCLMELPSVEVNPIGLLRRSDAIEEAHQKAIDLLTFYTHTCNFFVVLEPPPVKSKSNPWRDALERRKAEMREREAAIEARRQAMLAGGPGGPGEGDGVEGDSVEGGEDGKARYSRRIQSSSRAESVEKAALSLEEAAPHESSVVASLLGWLDQKEEGLDVSSLMGSAVLPEIESAYAPIPIHKLQYLESTRSKLLKQLTARQRRYEEWEPEVHESFPDAPPSLEEGATDAWPPPLPPTKLYGSPVMDAAIADNRDFDRLSLGLEGRLEDVYASKVLDELEKPASSRGNAIFSNLISALRAAQRTTVAAAKAAAKSAGNSRVSGVRLVDDKLTPPPPPVVENCTWVLCERCEKWRKLPPGNTGAAFADPFYCEHLKTVSPEFASCEVAEESNKGETQLKWGFGINDVNDLKVDHRVDAFCRRKQRWYPAVVVDTRQDAVCVRFPRAAGLPESSATSWLARHPEPGELPMVCPLYSFTDKMEDEQHQNYAYVETVKKEKSKFGPRVSSKDYANLFLAVPGAHSVAKAVQNTVLAVMAELINKVCKENGEQLGMIEVRVRKKVVVKTGGEEAEAAAAIARSQHRLTNKHRIQQREGIFMFFKEMSRILGHDVPYKRVMAFMDAMTTQQVDLWCPARWIGNKFGGWMDFLADEDMGMPGVPLALDEPAEAHVLVGMHVQTPVGEGVVLARMAPRRYAVAVAAQPGMVATTPYGEGRVEEVTPAGSSLVRFPWGVCHMVDLAITFEMFFAVPLDPMLFSRALGTNVYALREKGQPGGAKKSSAALPAIKLEDSKAPTDSGASAAAAADDAASAAPSAGASEPGQLLERSLSVVSSASSLPTA